MNSFEDVLTAVSSVTIAEVARDNKEVQDAMALEGAIPPLVALFKGKQLSVQVKGAMAVEALASYNPAIQRAFLEKSLSKYLLKLLKVGILLLFIFLKVFNIEFKLSEKKTKTNSRINVLLNAHSCGI